MPLARKKHLNPLMLGCFYQLGLSNLELSRRVGVSHSQIRMARICHVGADNAEKISSYMARALSLTSHERLQLKAEIMGDPGNPVRAFLGTPKQTALLLDIPEYTASEVLDIGKSITHKSGARALKRLREMEAPDFIVESVDQRLMPAPEPRRGHITHSEHGPEMAERRSKTRESLRHAKPRTHEAIQRSGLMLKEIYQRAGVGKETMRQALYKRAGNRSAHAIAEVLGEACRLSKSVHKIPMQ